MRLCVAAAAAALLGTAALAGCGSGGDGAGVPPPARTPPPGHFVGRLGDLGVSVDLAGYDAEAVRARTALRDSPRPVTVAIVSLVNDGRRPAAVPRLVATTADGRTVPLRDVRTVVRRYGGAAGVRAAADLAAPPGRVPARGSAVAHLGLVDVLAAQVTGVTAIGERTTADLDAQRR